MLGSVYHLNIYTAPALLALSFSIFGLVFITFAFKEQAKNAVRPKEQKYSQLKVLSHKTTIYRDFRKRTRFPWIKLLFLSVWLRGSYKFPLIQPSKRKIPLIFSVLFLLFSLLSPYSMMMWSYTEEQSVKHNSVVIFGAEVLGIFMLVLFVFKKIRVYVLTLSIEEY